MNDENSRVYNEEDYGFGSEEDWDYLGMNNGFTGG